MDLHHNYKHTISKSLSGQQWASSGLTPTYCDTHWIPTDGYKTYRHTQPQYIIQQQYILNNHYRVSTTQTVLSHRITQCTAATFLGSTTKVTTQHSAQLKKSQKFIYASTGPCAYYVQNKSRNREKLEEKKKQKTLNREPSNRVSKILVSKKTLIQNVDVETFLHIYIIYVHYIFIIVINTLILYIVKLYCPFYFAFPMCGKKQLVEVWFFLCNES